ncbi:hypothetical protein [Natronospora cellulosivora (SeqCode)]
MINKKIKVSLLILLFLCIPYNLYGNGFDFDFEFNFYIDSKVFSIVDLIQDEYFWPLEIRDESIHVSSQQKYTFQSSDSNFYFGYLRKSESNINIDEETIKFFYDLGQGRLLSSRYKFKVNTVSQTLDGIYFGATVINLEDYNIKIDLLAKLLRGLNLKRSYYNAEVSYRNGSFVLDGLSTSSSSFISQETSQEGIDFYSIGFSMDFLLEWQIDDLQSLSLLLEDIYSFIYWNDIYTSDGSYTSDNLVIEEDFITYLPPYSGRYYHKNYYSQLSPMIKLSYRRDRFEGGFILRNREIPYVSYDVLRREINNELMTINLGLYANQKQIDIDYSFLNLTLASDSINLSQSNSFNARVNINYQF